MAVLKTVSDDFKVSRYRMELAYKRARWPKKFKAPKKEKPGAKATLSPFELESLSKWCRWRASILELGPPTAIDIQQKVTMVLLGRGSNPRNVSSSWVSRFSKAHGLALRVPRALSQDRAGLTQQDAVCRYYTRMLEDEEKDPVEVIIIYDETGWSGFFETCKGMKIYVGKEKRQLANLKTSAERKHVTLVLGVVLVKNIATGKVVQGFRLPLVWVFPSAHLTLGVHWPALRCEQTTINL